MRFSGSVTTYYLQDAGQVPRHSIPLAVLGAAVGFGHDERKRPSGPPLLRKTPLPIVNTESVPAREPALTVLNTA